MTQNNTWTLKFDFYFEVPGENKIIKMTKIHLNATYSLFGVGIKKYDIQKSIIYKRFNLRIIFYSKNKFLILWKNYIYWYPWKQWNSFHRHNIS